MKRVNSFVQNLFILASCLYPPIAAFWIGVKFRIMDEGETR